LAYSLYKGPYSNFNQYSQNQSKDTSREDAIRRLLSFSSSQPSVSGSGFNDSVNKALQEQYESIYGDNVPKNTTLKIPQITNDPDMADNILDYSIKVPPITGLKAPISPRSSFYESLDNKFGGVLPGGADFNSGEYGISPEFAANHPIISRSLATAASPIKAVMDNPFADRSSQVAGQIVTTVDNPDMASTGSKGWDTAADLLGGIGGFALSPTGGVRSAGAQLFGVGEKTIERGLGLGNLPGMVKGLENLPGIVKTGIKLGGATIPYEAAMAALNDREFSPREAGMAGAANAVIGMALHGAGSVLGKRNTPTTPAEFKMPEYKAPDMSAFTPEELANIKSKSRPGEMITPDNIVTTEVAAAQRTLRNTLNVEKANKVLDEFPELEREFPYFRLQQGNTVILPNGKEGTVKTADKMIIQVDVDGKTVSIGRKVVKVPEVVSESISEVTEIATPEIKQQPIVNDVQRLNNRSGAETFPDENIPATPEATSNKITHDDKDGTFSYDTKEFYMRGVVNDGDLYIHRADKNPETKDKGLLGKAINEVLDSYSKKGISVSKITADGSPSFVKSMQNIYGKDNVAIHDTNVYNGEAQSDIEVRLSNTNKEVVAQEALPQTQIKVNRGSKGVANITLPDADHAMLFELDKQMKMLNNEKTYSHELEVLAEANYNKLKDKFPDPIGTADTYRRSVLSGAKDIEKDGTYAAETFETVKTKLDAEAKRFDIPVDKRNSKNVGDRKVNAMQYNHPELKPYVQEQAKNIMGDLAASLKAERGGTTVYGENTGPENISWGNKRMTTDTIAKILDEQKVSYADIDSALQRIIDDAGQENTALAKRIELLIDDHLTNGYTDIYGNKYPPNKEYVDAKNKAYGTDIKPKEQYKDMSDEDWQELEQLQDEMGKGEVVNKDLRKTQIEQSFAKEDWEVPKDIFIERGSKYIDEKPASYVHRSIVEQAFKEGKPVPPEVLKDYPELSAEVVSKPASEVKTIAEDIGLKPEKADELIIEGDKVTGSAESVPEQAGTYDPGTIGAARLTVPEKQSILPGTNEKVRSFQRTAIDAPVTDDMTKAGLLVDIYAEGPGAYKSITNIETEAAARKFIENDGIEESLKYVFDENEVSALKPAMAGQLAYVMQKQGRHDVSVELLESMGKQLTSAGQMAQAVKIFMNLSPEGVLIKANKETKKAFNELPKQTKDKHDDLSDKLQEEFDGIDKEAIDQVVNETPVLGGKKPKSKQGKPNPENQTDPANMLAQRIVSYVKPMMPASRLTPEMQMVKTLFSKAKEVLPAEKVKLPKKNALDEVVTALQQSDNYRKTWEDAKQSIIEQNGELPQVMKDVEAYIEHYLNVPYSERSLGNILAEAMKDKNFDLEQSAFGPMSPNFRGTKAENTAFIQSIVMDSGLSGKNAEVLSLELGSKLDEALKKKRDNKTSDLAKRIIKMATETPKGAESNPVKEMFNILMQKAKESMPKVEGTKSTKDGMLPIYNALNNRKMFNAVWSEAKKDIVKQLEAKGLSVEGANLDQMFAELLYHPYTKGQLSREVTKGIKQYGIDVNNIVRQHFTVAEKTGQTLAEKLTTRGMLSKDEAALLAQDIQARFAEVAETKKSQILKNMFREKSLTKEQKTIDQKIVELSNLGALSKEQYRRSVAEKMGLPVLTDDIANRLVMLAEQAQQTTGRKSEILRAQMAKILAEQQPVSFWRKVSSVQTFSQLINLKTATRNLVGNAGFNALENVSDVVGAGIDKGVSLVTGRRSKVLPSIATQIKGGIKGAKEGIEDAMLGIDTLGYEGKFDLPRSRTFKKGIMGKLETALNIELKATDRAFYESAKTESLRNQMAAAKVEKPTDAMIEQAHLDGLYRTFQDENILSNMFVGIKRILNANKEWGGGDLLLKYPKTPANLLMRGVDYSPAGFMKVLVEASRPLFKGEFNQKAFVEAFSRALVGSTALFGTGILLHKLGIITGRRDKDKELAELQRQNGFAEYRINVSALKRLMFGDGGTKPQNGDKIINYDWWLPNAIPIAIGADIDRNKGKATGLVGTTLNALSTGINAFAEQPVMQGFETLFSGAQGSFDQGLLRILEGVPQSFVPTFLNQVKQLADNQRRETYDPNKRKNMVNKVVNKVPGLSGILPQKYGTLGQPLETYQDGGNSLGNVLLNPAFVNTYNPSPEVQKIIDIYDQTGETKQVPRIVDKTIKVSSRKRVDGKMKDVTEEFELSGNEFSRYQKLFGEKTNAGIGKVSKSLTPEAQTKRIQDIMDKANQEAKIQILRDRGLRVIKNGTGIKILSGL